MKNLSQLTGILLSLLLVLGSTAFAADDLALLKQGRVVVKEGANNKSKDSVPAVSAKILIPKPPDQVWKSIMQPEHLMDKERKVKQIKVVSRNGTTKDLAYTVNLASILPTFNYTLRHQVTQPNTLQFRRINGSFKDIQGSWIVTPADNGKSSILTYNVSIDPGPLVPRFMMQNILKSDLPGMMNNVKSVINTQGN